MADKGPGSTGRSSGKRLARAKIKPTDNGIKSSKGRPVKQEEKLSEAQKKRARKQKVTGIVVGVFAVIMALSMMLPSLTYIFGDNGSQAEEQTASEEKTTETDESATDDETATDDEAETKTSEMDTVDANYKAVIDPLEAKLKENPKDLATLLNLGNNYMAWGTAGASYASEDADYEHLNELYAKAVEYFDKYLKLNDSVVVKTSRAMCVLYQGDTDQAIADLKALLEESPDHGPAWADLGMIYEYLGQTDDAKDAYNKAIEADPDDSYGAKSYANRRLAAMAANSGDGLTDEAAESVKTDSSSDAASGFENLENALGNTL